MSVKISSRQNSRRKPLVDNAQSEVLFKLGLGAFWTTPLDPASMLDIHTWNLENQPPVVPKYLPHAFLQRLWLLNPEARSTYCQPSPDSQANTQREDMVNGFGEESQCAANPLDLVTAVFMSANTFLQQDITVRMVQCQFAVPLVLPSVIPDQQSSFLLWPLRGVVSQWRSHSLSGVLEGDLASTKMPMMSFVKLGHCGVSKSWVLSRVLGGPKSLSQSFLHRGMDGGKLHRRLSNGLVELAWYLPTGDPDTDIFPVPVAISNLRGDAAAHEKCLSLLCRASSAVVVFCGNLREKEKRLLASWKGTASKIILIDLSDPGEEENENRVVGFVEQKLGDELGLPEGSVLSGGAVSEELLADRLLETLNDLLPGKLKHVTLEEAAGIAAELGLNVDEGAVCNKARATVEEVLKGLEEGSAQFREEQLPLQGPAWSTLSEMEKQASKQKKAGEVNIEQQNEARNILLKLSSYRMTPAMKVFTDALFTTDKMERTYFLRWMKLSLRAKQMRELHSLQGPIKNQQELLVQGSQEVETELTNENVIETENAVNRTIVGDDADDDSFCTASTEEENKSVEDIHAEKPLSMDNTEENELDTEHDVNVHVAGDSPINYDLESSCSEDLTEIQKLETQAGHMAQSEEVKLNSVLPDAGEVALNNLFEESTDENMESEEEPVHRPSDDDSFCTASTEEENNSVDDMLEEKPLSMDHSEESDPQQTKPELGTANDVNVHVAGDSTIKHDLESSCSEDLIENQKLETEAGHIAQSEEDKLNSAGEVTLNNSLEQFTDENMESEEEPVLRPSDDDDSFCTASTEEDNISVEDMLEEKPLSMDHIEESETQLLDQQTKPELDTEYDVNVQVAGDSPVKHDLESSCAERLIQEMLGRLLRETEIQKLETQAGHLVQSEEVKLNSVLPDAGEVALNNSLEESTDENMESEEPPAHRPSDDSFCTASTEEENNSVEDMLEEKPLSMDHTEESEPQVPEQQTELDTDNEVNVHVAGDSLLKHDLESSCSEDLIENQKLETEAGHIAQGEEDKLNSAGEVTLNNSLEQFTDENMESEDEPVLRPSDDDSFCTASTEEDNISVEDMLEEKPLSMDHIEESETLLLDQQTKPELDTDIDVKVHVAGDSPIQHDLESSCAERLIQEMLGRLLRDTEIQKLETQAGHLVQSEEVKLNSVLPDAGEVALNNSLEESTDENMESEEEPAHRPSDDSFCTASTEEENNSVEDMLEEKPLSMDHTEESEPQVPEQQTELDTDNEVNVHVAGDSLLKHDLESSCAERLIQEMLGRLLRETEIQKLETQAGHIVQSEEVKLNSVLPDAGEVALNNSLEESTDENMESEEEPAPRPSDDSFCTASTEEENNSVEDMLEEKPLSMDHTEESESQVPEQQTELDTDNEVKVHVAGDSPLKHDLESNCSEDLTEIEKLETEAGHIAQCEEVQLNTVLPDAGEAAPNHSIEESTNENMESEEELVKKYSEMQDGEQNLSPQTTLENTDLDLRPTTTEQNELEPTIEQQIYLTPDENRTMGPASTEIQDSFEDQEMIDQVNSADQQYHLESETMGEESEVPKIESQQTDSNPSVQNNLDLMDFSKKNHTDTVSLTEHGFEPDPFSLGLEHFLREMGLIFELTHISPGNGSHNVLRLPSLAADLLLYGIPLELMDGDASNIPSSWLGCVLAEFKRRLSADGVRIRVLTNLGVHPARNGEVLSALFGANFPTRGKGFIKGIYMQPLCLPGELRRDMECDLLLMIDVEGLCSPESGREEATQVHDNEMATVATGLSDVLLHNLASNGAAEFESNLTVLINALLRTEVCGNTPVCKLLIQDEGLNSKLQALQLGRVTGILQAEPEKIEIKNNQKPISNIKSSIPCLIGPWQNISISQPVDKGYSEVVLQLKQSLFEAFEKCAAKSKATGLPEFMGRLCAIWEAVKAESFSIGLGNTEVAASFSMMCTELSQWEQLFLENMEIWFMGAQKRITSTKTKASETRVKGKLLSLLKDEAMEEVKAEVDKIRLKLEAYLTQNDQNKTNIEAYLPNIMNNMNELQEQVTEDMIERLELAKDNHYVSTHLRTFEAFLEKEQELKLHMLVENSKLTTVLLEDMQLEEEFEPVWDNALSTFDLRPSQTSDINTRVIEILIDNLNSRGLQKHIIRLQKIGKKNTAGFEVHDEHFGYNTRMKYMFEDNNKKQRLAAHCVACTIIEEYNRFVAEKSNLLADFSDGYITELLENVEKTLRANPMEIRSAFEVDLKVYICSFACKDFQEIHDRYAKDRDLLAFIKRSKERRQGEFIYQFRKRDQCHRVAQAFTSMVFKPTALDYIYESLGRHIVEEIVSQENGQQYLSPLAFNCSLLEKLLDEDSFESFLEYLLSYESFSLKKIQERVLHLSKSAIFDEWRRHRLGEIVGKMSAAVSQTSAGVSEKLSDTKLLLEMVCLNLEKERDVAVTRASLDGPLFSITVEWDYFVSCLLEALAEMRLALAHEFSQDTDIAELLQALPVQPQESLFNRVRGCEKQCPFCRAPCEVGGVVHDMHRAVLHRPKGMLSYTYHDSCTLSHTSCLADTTKENLFLNEDTDGQSLAYRDYSSLYPDWSIHPVEPDTKTPIAYWRYVLMRFNERFAEEYEQQPAQLPDDWLHITREEALESLREASTLSSVGGYHNNYTL